MKTERIQLRVTLAQKRVLHRKAKKIGLGLSEWLLAVAMAAKEGEHCALSLAKMPDATFMKSLKDPVKRAALNLAFQRLEGA